MSDQSIGWTRHRAVMEAFSLIAVIGLLLLTAYGDAVVMFFVSLAALLLLFVWFLASRKTWLAVISGLTFLVCALFGAKPLF